MWILFRIFVHTALFSSSFRDCL